MYTKGKFNDKTKGWKAVNCGNHWNNKVITNWQIQWSDDGECISDHVYEEDDAKLIAAAPDMFEQLTSIIDGTAFDKETGLIWEHRLEEIRKVLNKAVGSDSF